MCRRVNTASKKRADATKQPNKNRRLKSRTSSMRMLRDYSQAASRAGASGPMLASRGVLNGGMVDRLHRPNAVLLEMSEAEKLDLDLDRLYLDDVRSLLHEAARDADCERDRPWSRREVQERAETITSTTVPS